jgi:hypothetical protein
MEISQMTKEKRYGIKNVKNEEFCNIPSPPSPPSSTEIVERL